jgi:hypothetical protein
MNQYRHLFFLLISFLLISCSQGTSENAELKFLGNIKPMPTTCINSNSWTIGCEVLDRDYADYSSYKRYLGELGAKTARLQLGWAKCEKEKGIYDFRWIKVIVEDLKAKMIRPWLQFSYGNPIYRGGGDPTLAGGMPRSEEALNAWDNWVRLTVSQFKDYTNYWEVWNEPNLPDKNNVVKTPEEYGKFFVRTAEIIKKQQPEAVISGLVLCGMHKWSFEYIKGFLDYLRKSGKLDLLDEITYHPYPEVPEETYPLADSLRHLLTDYSNKIKIKHGETGCPATFNTSGVLANHDWTEISQSKWLLRRMCGDYAYNIPTSIFTMIDFTYPVTKSLGHSYTLKMGLLAKDSLNQEGKKRTSFFSVQNAINLLNENWRNAKIADYTLEQKTDGIKLADIYCYQMNNRNADKIMLMIWLGNKVPENSIKNTLVNLNIHNAHFEDPVMVDLLSGKVFSISRASLESQQNSDFHINFPVYDSPLIITEKSEISIVKASSN